MKTILSYPKVFHIGENYIENLFKSEVEITSKIDGSMWCYGINEDGDLVMRSKGEDLTNGIVPKMFEKAYEQSKRIYEIIKDKRDLYFYCEFMGKPKHNILEYDRIPKNNLYLFGVREGMNFVSDFNKICEYADLLDIERPHLLYQGIVNSIEDIKWLLDKDSILGKTKIEGIVVKNYEYPAILKGYIIPISMGKYVREDFKEKHKTEWHGHFTGKGRLEILLDSYKTEARWMKAIQHLKEKDQLTNSPKDIGILMKEIEQDLLEEETENIKDGLFKIFQDDFIRKSRGGFAEWYKKCLLEKSFNK